jgi:acetolactate synthase-1/2/3 large subunit
MDGGELIARTLAAHGVEHLFTLCGGHISPILVGAKRCGIRVVDVRHEADAVFAADAAARLTGRPGVAAVTAGPGATNTVTAVKNAQLAQSPVVVLGGATGTILKGRGALQDIDQLALMGPHVKWAAAVERVHELPEAVAIALRVAATGVPGPAFVECPVDLLYDEGVVRELYGAAAPAAGAGTSGGGLARRLRSWYLRRHVDRLFRGAGAAAVVPPRPVEPEVPDRRRVAKVAARLLRARRPVLIVGNQAMLRAGAADDPAAGPRLAAAVGALGVPTYLASTARGLLGVDHPVQLRHRRRQALREADLVLLAGYPADFRLDYGRQIPRGATLVAANLSDEEMRLNRRPDLGVPGDPALFLLALAAAVGVGGRGGEAGEVGGGEAAGGAGEAGGRWGEWLATLRGRDAEREAEIAAMAAAPGEGVNPVHLCREIDRAMGEEAVVVADGGDFVATAAYTVRPRGPLGWLDPGAFGTLGVGGGFALGAGLCRPGAEVWLLWGDGSAAYSLAEFDAFVRHRVPVVAVVGNDAGWTQIAREQVPMLGDDVGTTLARTDYHRVAEGYGGEGLLLAHPADVVPALARARELAAEGRPVLVNALLGKSEFRKGAISM